MRLKFRLRFAAKRHYKRLTDEELAQSIHDKKAAIVSMKNWVHVNVDTEGYTDTIQFLEELVAIQEQIQERRRGRKKHSRA
jgi:hypothetical protein